MGLIGLMGLVGDVARVVVTGLMLQTTLLFGVKAELLRLKKLDIFLRSNDRVMPTLMGSDKAQIFYRFLCFFCAIQSSLFTICLLMSG